MAVYCCIKKKVPGITGNPDCYLSGNSTSIRDYSFKILTAFKFAVNYAAAKFPVKKKSHIIAFFRILPNILLYRLETMGCRINL